jgi:glycosyltransferase involved in cell wall biosynthesis
VESLLNSSPSNVKFEGHRSARRIAEKYREADILCCPSIWQEPFGNVNIEAMASGIPVVATRVGGIPEIAAEGGVLLVEPNSAVGLADALQRLVEDKELRMEVAAKGLKAFHRRYTWAAVCRQYQEIMESI